MVNFDPLQKISTAELTAKIVTADCVCQKTVPNLVQIRLDSHLEKKIITDCIAKGGNAIDSI